MMLRGTTGGVRHGAELADLTGMVAVTLSTLGRGAKFAEIGKRDIWSPARVAQERPMSGAVEM